MSTGFRGMRSGSRHIDSGRTGAELSVSHIRESLCLASEIAHIFNQTGRLQPPSRPASLRLKDGDGLRVEPTRVGHPSPSPPSREAHTPPATGTETGAVRARAGLPI